MSRQARKLLHDALQAAHEILDIAEGLRYRDFVDDIVRQKAIYYDFAVLGEALKRLDKISPQYTIQLSALRPAIDMRNRLIHGYSSVDTGVVWSTIEQDIPNLRDELQALLLEDLPDTDLHQES